MRTVLLGPTDDPPRVAYAVGRGLGNAVTRNRVRRQLRAVTRENAGLLDGGAAYLVRARPGVATTSTSELSSTMRAILTQLSGRSS